MSTSENTPPPKAANKLVKVTELFHQAHGTNMFPINVDQLALGSAEIFHWDDPITKIEPADIKNFEGALHSNENKSKWKISYNNTVSSEGRIRFTKAHELGHYILHRELQSEFLCGKDDMLNWSHGIDIENQADVFASYLLMPLNDFRIQIGNDINLNSLSHCADRYGVSLTAAALKWLSYTTEKALIIMSNDGFISWASASDSAFKAGAYFKTKTQTIEIPSRSLTANTEIECEMVGQRIPAKLWFKHADTDADALEMKIYSNQYDCTLTLLVLPRYGDFWMPRDS